ncbi:MAG TPA: S8 family serine peptidase, partial [Pyrinomonadaceae bacterium]
MKSVSPSSPRRRPSGRGRTRRATPWLGLALLLAVAAACPFVTHGSLQTGADETAPRGVARAGEKPKEFVPGRVLVRFRSDTAAKAAESSVSALAKPGGETFGVRVERFEGSELVKGLRLAAVEPADTLAAVAAFKDRADVLYAEPDYVRHIARTPNESSYTNLWSLKNTAQPITVSFGGVYDLCNGSYPCTLSAGTSGADIKAEQAWDITTGSRDIVVGVIDEGMDISQPDLAANIWTNPGEVAGNGFDDDGNGFIDDVHGWDFAGNNNSVFDGSGNYPNDETDAHGTHVAGTIGAQGNNNIGSVGINWQVSILPLKFIGASGSGSSSNAIRAAAYAKALRDKYVATGGAQGANVRVLNNSYGGGGFLQSEQDSIAALANSGILFVVAAGNESNNNDVFPTYPANYNAPNLISVAATTRRDAIDPSYSNFGARTVHIAAPGSLILSTTPNNTYDFYYGTSMASPHVAGAAALALAANPNLDVTHLRGALLYSGDFIASANGKTYTGRRLNAYNTVRAALENDTTAPAAVGNLRLTTQVGRTVTVAWTAPGDDGNTGQAALYELSFLDTATNARIFLRTQVPQAAGAAEGASFTLPFRHLNGQISVKAIDNVGNESALASVPVSVSAAAGDPYVPAESAATALTTGGTPLNLHADDSSQTVNLPFNFPFYGQNYANATISTNGIIYLGIGPTGNDAGNDTAALNYLTAVAGLWDDLRTDRRAGDDIYVTQDADRVVYRWQSVTYDTPIGPGTTRGENPVNFEIELRRDGTIITRYGSGNSRVAPVVGISGGAPDAYVIASHTSPNALVNMPNAQTVTYAPRASGGGSPTVQFTGPTISVGEGARALTINVTRTGDASATGTVNITTVDDPAEVPCSSIGSTAYARCDYATTVETLSFGANETSKTISIPIIDDGYAENQETFQLALGVATGGISIGPQAVLTVTILDNDAPGAPNPIFTTPFFVRQHYLDFLAREPEPTEPWSAILNGCPNVNNTDPSSPSAGCDRLTVSGAFFGSPEFLNKGIYTIVFYRAAFGRLPAYTEFAQDLRSVTGATAAETNAKRAAFAVSFTQRSEFAGQYNGLDNAAYVATLLGRYGLTQLRTPDPANPDGTQKVTLTNAQLTNALNAGTLTRAQVLRAVVQSDEVSQ